ncbi:MAG TPA: T9SS type A sorting domain-containing protein [Puia sp.]|nr:T9SS type A sorting domain-containing protein [Puia sp.]
MLSSRLFPLLWLLTAPALLWAQPAYPPAPPAPATISAIEWFIDSDPGFGNGAPLSFAAASDIPSLIAHIPLAGVRPGIHRLFLRSQDNAGNWTLTASAGFENFHPAYAPPAAAPVPVTELEVFFDHDPGFGNGFRQTLAAGADINDFHFTVGVDTLSPGTHQLFIRSFSNSWGLSEVRSFRNDVILPVSWLYIRGELTGDQTLISWATALESNTLRFDIERSSDGLVFKTVGAHGAAGNSNTSSTYQWIDDAPAPGLNYYRVRQVDIDGKFSWSAIVSVLYRKGMARTVLTPNPATGRVMLLFAKPAEAAVLAIYNSAGQSVLSGKIEKGALQQSLDLGALAPGMYVLQLRYGNSMETLRVLKR